MNKRCYACGHLTDEWRFCLHCGHSICWEHVVRIDITVHNDEGRRTQTVYVCPECGKNETMNILELLKKQEYETPEIEGISKMIDILEGD